jgi:drug/metabolite transporter (DMT)-like permease
MAQDTHLTDWFLLAFLVVAWGSAFAMIKIAVSHFDAAWVMALRLVIAALILAPYALAAGLPLSATASAWGKFTWLGFIGHAAPFFLIAWGTHYVSSGVSGLLMGFPAKP